MVLGRFDVHIGLSFWVEVNVNKVYLHVASTFFVAVAAYIHYCIKKTVPPSLVIFGSPAAKSW